MSRLRRRVDGRDKPGHDDREHGHDDGYGCHLALDANANDVFMIRTMNKTAARPEIQPAPPEIRDALSEIVQIGLRVARMIGEVADAETALAKSAADIRVAEGVSPMATSLAEAIEADRATAAAAEARHSVVARAEAIAAAFARVSRAIRLTVAMLERLDRGWARGRRVDDRIAMAKRQIARGVNDAITREAEGERAEDLRERLTERLDSEDWEDLLENHDPQEVIDIICRQMGLDPVRMTVRSPLPGIIKPAAMEGVVPRAGSARQARPPPQWPPDG
jgi:hypothetical protein